MEKQKSPAPAPLRGWVACWTQQCWRDLSVPAVDITADILSLLCVVAAVVVGTNLVHHSSGHRQSNLWTIDTLLS